MFRLPGLIMTTENSRSCFEGEGLPKDCRRLVDFVILWIYIYTLVMTERYIYIVYTAVAADETRETSAGLVEK